MADFTKTAQGIVDCLGGVGNLTNVTHCATRVRILVRSEKAVKLDDIKKVDGVIDAFHAAQNSYQVVVGQTVEDVYNAVLGITGDHLAGGEVAEDIDEKKGGGVLKKFQNFLLMMADIMSPLIPPLIASGFLSCVLLLMQLLFHVSTDSSTYKILYNLSQTVFYFMPVLVAYTSAKKFKTEAPLAMVLAAWLIYPDWVSMVGDLQAQGQTFTTYFGIPTLLNTYNGSVLQIVLVVWVMSKVDNWLKKVLPVSVRHFMKPFLLLLIMSVITLPLLAPLGGLVTNYIMAFVSFVRTHAPWLQVTALVLFACTLGVFMPGFHMALMPIAINSLAQYGFDDLINIWFFCCTITPGFLALAVGLKTKKNKLKQLAFPAAVSALFGGISEPTTYGIIYKIPKMYYIYAASAIATSLYAGIVGLKCYAFGGYSLTNILLYYGPNKDTQNLIFALIGVVIMAVIEFILVFTVKWDDSMFKENGQD